MVDRREKGEEAKKKKISRVEIVRVVGSLSNDCESRVCLIDANNSFIYGLHITMRGITEGKNVLPTPSLGE